MKKEVWGIVLFLNINTIWAGDLDLFLEDQALPPKQSRCAFIHEEEEMKPSSISYPLSIYRSLKTISFLAYTYPAPFTVFFTLFCVEGSLSLTRRFYQSLIKKLTY